MAVVKRRPEDFIVRERCDLAMNGGKYAVYQLTKRGLGTPEAIDRILTEWDLSRFQVAYAGLKDRHAVTTQTLTIKDGPEADLIIGELSLIFVGRADRPVSAGDVVSNSFEITLRDMNAAQIDNITRLINQGNFRTPNYFDSQRFGSIGVSGELIGKFWCLGNYEKALFLAMAEHNDHDRPREREQKDLLQANWGDWQRCKELLERGHRRSIITYLVDHPTKFKKAFGLIRRDLRSLYVSALQSFIWNRLASRYIAETFNQELLKLDSVVGDLYFPVAGLDAADQLSSIPLPSGRKTNWLPEIASRLDQILDELGLNRHQLRVSYPRDVFFSRAARPLWLESENLQAHIADSDDSEERVVHLQFELGRGQYATMLLKHIDLMLQA